VERPSILRKDLTLRLKTGVSTPKLGAKHQTAKGLDTARVDIRNVLGRARQQRLLELASVVELALARVELGIGRAGKQSCCCESTAHLGMELTEESIAEDP
jgi:hypothetical protein